MKQKREVTGHKSLHFPGASPRGRPLKGSKTILGKPIEVYLESQEKDVRSLKKTDRVVAVEV